MDRYKPGAPMAWPMDPESPDNGRRPPLGEAVISAGDHVIEPPDLWRNNMPAKWHDSSPQT